jgi:hypothetical protein
MRSVRCVRARLRRIAFGPGPGSGRQGGGLLQASYPSVRRRTPQIRPPTPTSDIDPAIRTAVSIGELQQCGLRANARAAQSFQTDPGAGPTKMMRRLSRHITAIFPRPRFH